MEPTPRPEAWEASSQAVRQALLCRATRRAVADLRRLSIAKGTTASSTAPAKKRKRLSPFRQQGATFPSVYAPPQAVPDTIHDVHTHVKAAMAAEHPSATEAAAVPDDVRAAARLLLEARSVAEVHRRKTHVLATIRRVSNALGDVRARVKALQQRHVRDMVQPIDAALLYCLAEAAECPDSLDLAVGVAVGFEAVGDISPSGWWDGEPQLAEKAIEDLDHAAWHDRLEANIARAAQTPHRAAEAAAVLERTLEEVKQGLMRGPFTRAQVDAAYGPGEWRAMHRFGVWQGAKCRGCDNARGSEHNDCTSVFEQMLLERADFPARVCSLFAELSDALQVPMPGMAGGTDDLKDAYRHVPTNAPHMTVVVMGDAEGCPQYFTLPGFNFGLKSAVPQFNRVTEATCAIARRLLGVVCSKFFDDFVVVEPAATCAESQDALRALHALIGFPFAEAKHVRAASEVTFLGVVSNLADAHVGVVTMRVTQKRMASISDMCSEALDSGRLPAAVAAKLAGKLMFTLTWVFGRVGRACLQPILHPPPDGSDSLTRSAAAALRFLLQLLPRLRPMRIDLRRAQEAPALVYTDGCHEGATLDVGYLIAVPHDATHDMPPHARTAADYTWVHGGGPIPHDIRDAFVERKQQIGQVEIIGGLVPYLSHPALLAGRRIIHFIDNSSAVAALTKGYSNLPDSARLVHTFHAWQACAQTDVWFDYVRTKANPSDEPSRDPSLWGSTWRPGCEIVSQPGSARFAPLTSARDASAWQLEADAARDACVRC